MPICHFVLPEQIKTVLQATLSQPVIAADGHTYEKHAIEAWLKERTVSPVTGMQLAHTRLVCNFVVKSAIASNMHCQAICSAEL